MSKPDFMGVYKRFYDPAKEGFGHGGKWRSSFRQRMSPEVAQEILKGNSAFTVLGVTPQTAWVEIKRAYRTLAVQWHPDLCKLPEAEEKMKRINAAFTLLEIQFGKV